MEYYNDLDTEIELIPKRIKAGAKFLDEKAPLWWQSIMVMRLDQSSNLSCLLAQLSPTQTYKESPLRSKVRKENADRGFCEPTTVSIKDTLAYYHELSICWRYFINERRTAHYR